ncbi:MAG: hypothetical protein WA160_12975 [Pseudobdellovibrio sp.]
MKILELLHKNISFIFTFVLRKTHLQILFFKLAWRLKNKNNKTLPVNLFNSFLVKVGKMSYGPLIFHDSGALNEGLEIGGYVSIPSGVTLNKGSVVTKSVPAFAIVDGNPARLIKFRFGEEIRRRLEKIDFSLINWAVLKMSDKLFTPN